MPTGAGLGMGLAYLPDYISLLLFPGISFYLLFRIFKAIKTGEAVYYTGKGKIKKATYRRVNAGYFWILVSVAFFLLFLTLFADYFWLRSAINLLK